MNQTTYQCLRCGGIGYSIRCKACGGDAEPIDLEAPIPSCGYTIFSHAQLGHSEHPRIPIGEAHTLHDDPQIGDTVEVHGADGIKIGKVVDVDDRSRTIQFRADRLGRLYSAPLHQVTQIIRHL